MNINDIGMEGRSLSKKWRLAVKAGLFEGSFKEFADLYNQKIDDNGESQTFSDDAQQSIGAADLAPVDVSGTTGKILGMTPKTLIIVSTVSVLVIGIGIVYFVRLGKKEE